MSERATVEQGKPNKKPVASLVACIWLTVVLLLFLSRSDALFALTVWPAWVLLLPGLIPLAFRNQPKAVLAGFWMACLLAIGEEPWSLARSLLPHKSGQLRVVSLNCAGGSLEAAREVILLKPDIILFQESPSRPDLEKLAKEAFGERGQLVWGLDASILAREDSTARKLPRGTSNYVSAHWRDAEGRQLNLVALRLQPPVLRLDLYNSEAWSDFSRNRQIRREELSEIWELNRDHVPDILGGDFNSPAERDGLGRQLGEMKDSFGEAGRGYGATCVNPLPCLVRIDQIWRSPKLKTVNSFVVKTKNSDHRMVVSDFTWVN